MPSRSGWTSGRRRVRPNAKGEEEREADAVGIVPAEKEREEREIKPPSESRSDSYEDFKNYPPRRREYDTEELFRLRDAQARADVVAQLFGERAPPPVTGEPLREYRERLLHPWQRYSAYKGANLTKIGDPKAFDAIEAQIYSDAAKASEDPDAPPGRLREIRLQEGDRLEYQACPALTASSRPWGRRALSPAHDLRARCDAGTILHTASAGVPHRDRPL